MSCPPSGILDQLWKDLAAKPFCCYEPCTRKTKFKEGTMFNLNKKYEAVFEMYCKASDQYINELRENVHLKIKNRELKEKISELEEHLIRLSELTPPTNGPSFEQPTLVHKVRFKSLNRDTYIHKDDLVLFPEEEKLYRCVGSLAGRDSFVFELASYPGVSLVAVYGHDLFNGTYKLLEVTNG